LKSLHGTWSSIDEQQRCSSVRAKRGGELTGLNPTDRGKAGTKYHVAVATDGLPVAVVPSAANVHDTRLFPYLVHLAQVVCAAIGRLYANAAYDSAANHQLCRRDGIQPCIRKAGEPRRARRGRLRGRAQLRVVVGQQETGPAPGQARPDDPGPSDPACIFIVANRVSAFLKPFLIVRRTWAAGFTGRSPASDAGDISQADERPYGIAVRCTSGGCDA
jgi:hypothetical protein